jgi:hypothetical protein
MAEMNKHRLEELKALADANGGLLTPAAVVERAENPKSALHGAFEWDDTEAARKYRLEQARQLIRVTVEVIRTPTEETKVTAFFALRGDRYEEGGYRHMPTLVKTQAGREAILATALWELEAFRDKYAQLTEIAHVFSAIRKARTLLKAG